ncbi:MAG TPA: histidine kinase [Xanthomonadaceae bacterium]|nr:histidine kinase [Xanthomonadaceae bacterium]
MLDRVPEAFFAIHSATGEAAPRQVMAVPLLLQDRLLGVFEFGTFGAIGAAAEGFVEELLPTAALGLDNIRRAEHTRELLEKTRAQALALEQSEEKLRMQEELRATNEELQQKTVELEEHTQRLAASEEELRVQAEELQASNEELRQKSEILNEQKQVLEDLQRETELKAQALARASQYKTDFLANMSHELRTPLNSLLILSKELAENAQQHLDAEEVESAQVIHDSGSNLLRLINDILDLSKIEAGKMDVYREEVEVEAITREVMRHFRHVALDNRLAFDIEVGDDVPATLGTDRPKLQQILNNLLGNAFKFTHEGSVTLRVVRAGHALLRRIGADDAAHYLAMSVADTGIGIPQERLDSIFEAFEQVDSSTSRHYGGSGLGLAIARKLAQLLGGQLLADSVVEEGSTFTLMLPLDEVAPVAAAAPARPVQDMMRNPAALSHAATPAPRLTDWIPDDRHTISPGDTVILTIEDDPAFARILVDMIRRKGHRALAAADGETGLELARSYRPTAILLDVMLPGMDGWSVMEQLRREPALRSIPVHFISAVDEAAKGEAMGAVGYLTKPVDRKALTDAFDRLLDVAGKIVRRLLLVDDDADSRLAIRHLLQGEKLQIDEAASGEEALEKLQGEGYDCIVLDLNLGGISGAELLERASARMPLPPVVIYSGHELSREESLRLRQYTDSIVIKGLRSQERLLDEVSLFLHSIGSRGAQGAQEADGGLSSHSVLLVDDDMRNLFALSKSLRARGMNVLMAQDGFKALRQLEENDDAGLVLMDIMMPGMDGYETTREIRRQPQWAHLPIIAVTAKAMPGDRDKCLDAGANDYLTKPVDLDKLLSMMRVWLQT